MLTKVDDNKEVCFFEQPSFAGFDKFFACRWGGAQAPVTMPVIDSAKRINANGELDFVFLNVVRPKLTAHARTFRGQHHAIGHMELL